LGEDELRAIGLLTDLAENYWRHFRQPCSLARVGHELAASGIKYSERLSSGKLKDFVKRTEAAGQYRLVQHPDETSLMGIVPARARFNEKNDWHDTAPPRLSLAAHKVPPDSMALEALDGVPSAFDYRWSKDKRVVLDNSSANIPVFPFPSSERDHDRRLSACRELSSALASDIRRKNINVRGEYRLELERYGQRLPDTKSDGNIILADATMRILRSLFAAEVSVLPASFAASLKIILEQHIALRPYYPELETLYRDIRSGRLEEPLPLDAVDGVVYAIQEATPQVFDPSVSTAIDESATPIVSALTEDLPSVDPSQPLPPPDPLGELDPKKSRDFQVAAVINKLWAVFLDGERIHKSSGAWRTTYEFLAPHVTRVLQWLHGFIG